MRRPTHEKCLSDESRFARHEPRRSAFTRSAWALLALSALLGCTTLQTYPGPRAKPSEVARIAPTDRMFGTSIRILSVDGVALSTLQRGAELLPGSHRIRGVSSFGFIGATTRRDFALRFDAEAGRSYSIFAEMYAHGTRVWIADDELHTVAELDPGFALPDGQATLSPGDGAHRAEATRPDPPRPAPAPRER
jgi:hypothetical protein